MCTPSRGVLTTGPYSHQTGCLHTGEGPTESTLAARFPTWGTMLHDAGYRTWWWGKWHLGHEADNTPDGLDVHGFSGSTYPVAHPRPLVHDGVAGESERHLPVAEKPSARICSALVRREASQFRDRRRAAAPRQTPIADRLPELHVAVDDRCDGLHGARRGGAVGPVPRHVLAAAPAGTPRSAGCPTPSRPDIDSNTVVVFTSDHGEYAGSHGLRGKGAAVYDESIRVPLYIRDPSGHLTPTAGQERNSSRPARTSRRC